MLLMQCNVKLYDQDHGKSHAAEVKLIKLAADACQPNLVRYSSAVPEFLSSCRLVV